MVNQADPSLSEDGWQVTFVPIAISSPATLLLGREYPGVRFGVVDIAISTAA